MRLAYPGADTDLARSRTELTRLVTAVNAAFPNQLRLGSSIRTHDSYPDHRSGAAVDLMTLDLTLHNRVCDWLITQHQTGTLRLRSIISNRRRYTPTTGWGTYAGANPHTDHVHVWLDLTTTPASYPLAGVTRGGRAACYGNRRGPAHWVGGYHTADRPAIRRIQAVLRAAGYDLGGGGIDGIYGNLTETAVRAYQHDHNLTPDGLVGPATWAEMMR